MQKKIPFLVLVSLISSSTVVFAQQATIELDETDAKCRAHVVLEGYENGSRKLRIDNSKCDELTILRPNAPEKKYRLIPGTQSYNVTWMDSRLEIVLDGEKLVLLAGERKSGVKVVIQESEEVRNAATAQRLEIERKRKEEEDRRKAKEKAAKVAAGAAAAVIIGVAVEDAATKGEN